MDLNSTRVLLVEDDNDAAEEMEESVRRSGFAVVRATDGQEALSMVTTRPDIGVIVTDINMPRMDGLAFVESLRRLEHPDREWEVVFISGESRIDYPIRAIRHRPIEYLQKPVRSADLCEAVRRAFETARKRAMEASIRSGMLVSLRQMRALVNSIPVNFDIVSEPAAGSERAPTRAIAPIASPSLPLGSSVVERTPAASGEPELAERIKRLVRAHNSRALFFDAALFSDPCWEMLLDLMSNQLLGRQISVSSLCIASGVPQTTALRRIEDLAQAGLIERVADPVDRRRVYIKLKDDTVEKLERYIHSFWSLAAEGQTVRRI